MVLALVSKTRMIERITFDNFAIAWQYPGLGVAEIIPAVYSRTKKPVQCRENLDCDDGLWCNGAFCLLHGKRSYFLMKPFAFIE